MPVEQGLPWHPVATGLAGQAIPFTVAASHAHALPSTPFWFPVPAVLVASPSLLCPSSLSGVLALVPPGVAPAFCVSVLLLPLSVGAPGCPCRAPPPVPPACPPRTRISHLRMTWTVPCAVGWSLPCCYPRGRHLPARRVQLGALWSTWAPCRGPRCGTVLCGRLKGGGAVLRAKREGGGATPHARASSAMEWDPPPIKGTTAARTCGHTRHRHS